MLNTCIAGIALAATAALAAAQSAAPAAPAAAPKTWADTVTFKGDVRYRYERIDQDGADLRERNRIRARLGAEAKVNDDVKAGIQMSTGESDPVSGNQTLTGEFNKKDMKLDLAYFDWSLVPDKVNVIAGKMKNPFITMQDLIWDSDLTPEGIALNARTQTGIAEWLANGGYLWVNERSGEDDDSMLYAGQLATKLQFTPEVYLLVGGSYYGYDNMEGYPVLDWQNKNGSYGNSTTKKVSGSTTNSLYATDFTQLEGFAELGMWVGVPLTFYGDYVVNTDASSDDTGYLAGLALGKAKNPKTYEVGYNYRELEKDAVVGAFSDSDSWGGGTNGKGHKFYARYQLMKNLQVGGAFFLDEKGLDNGVDYNRLQLDLVAKF